MFVRLRLPTESLRLRVNKPSLDRDRVTSGKAFVKAVNCPVELGLLIRAKRRFVQQTLLLRDNCPRFSSETTPDTCCRSRLANAV